MATIKTKRADNFRCVFSFMEDGEAANLSGCSARMQLRTRAGTMVIDVSTDDHLTVDGVAGTVTANVPATMMEIAAGRYYADVELVYADGTVRSSNTFQVTVVQDITRDD